MLRRAIFALTLIAVAPGAGATAFVAGVDCVGMTVSDLDRSLDFYTRVLTFERVSQDEVTGERWERAVGIFGVRARSARLRLGGEFIELTEYLAPRGRPAPADTRSNDRWFQHIAIVVSDMEQAYARLRRHRVQHSSPGPQRLPDWNRNAGGIQAFYFRDPDGHPLELLSFPPDKGAAKWRERTGRLFLGIDHTAIVVSDTARSVAFYRDVLGMRVTGESENYGPEQERLNNVFGARLRITSLRAASGPGIEFLEYLTPGDGRSYPPDAKANDLVHSQTRLLAPDLEGAAQVLRKAGAAFVSPGIVQNSVLVRDPDGHALQLAGPSRE